ncbi:MAG: FliH/SctL family protein [Terracidiphilus sp.]|nr:FliH/SctL family protein [Terracidiphilus sp.]
MYDAGTIWEEGKGGVIEPFEYLLEGSEEDSSDQAGLDVLLACRPEAAPSNSEPSAVPPPTRSSEEIRREWEERLAEETRRAFDAGCQQGLKSEREAHAAALHSIEEQRRTQAGELLNAFIQERDRYLENVEQEVVHLALAVAARILRREAQMDPLLLTGAVRVALGQLSATTSVRLRIPAEDSELWEQAIAHLPNLKLRPQIITDASLHLGECALETGLGSVDLGLRSQLAEIERGFFDRAPRARIAETATPSHGVPQEEAAS